MTVREIFAKLMRGLINHLKCTYPVHSTLNFRIVLGCRNATGSRTGEGLLRLYPPFPNLKPLALSLPACVYNVVTNETVMVSI